MPRSKFKEADSRAEMKRVGVYFLVERAGISEKPEIYIGEAENCYNRLKDHNREKDFWELAVLAVSSSNTFTKTDVRYLEWYSYNQCQKFSRFKLNQRKPTKCNIDEGTEAGLRDTFETIKLLVSVLGFPIFEEIQKTNADDQLFCTGKSVTAKGFYGEDGFRVFSGSEMALKNTSQYEKIRRSLEENKIVKKTNDKYIFRTDHIFGSPSTAASVILGRQANGWKEWKRYDGKTLSDIKR